MSLSVIIAACNEELGIAASIRSAWAAGASEVIVSDGASTDATVAIARRENARVISGPRMRSKQLNLGAAEATGVNLLFLHADTQLPSDASLRVREALENGATFGGFRIAFTEGGVRLAVSAFLINIRSRLTRCPWGDQAQFLRRDLFESIGGFREIPLMEDYELAIRMKRAGQPIILPASVSTSARRFLRRGMIRTVVTNWWIVLRYRFGTDPETLAALYRR